MQDRPVRVFVSYAHKDRRYLEQFRTHTADLRRNGVEIFDDQAIMPGERWEPALTAKLDTADIVVFLVTAELVNSDFCHQIEFARALERESAGLCMIIPVNLGPVDLDNKHPLRAFQNVPQGKAICEMASVARATAWRKVAKALRDRAEEMRANGTFSSDQDRSPVRGNVYRLSTRREKVASSRSRNAVHPSLSRRMHQEDLSSIDERRAPGDWRYLADLLRVTRFDSSDWKSLAMSTGRLREELEHLQLPNGLFPARAEDVADSLRYTLATAVSPSATPASVRSACVTCERLKNWLLDILTGSSS